MSSKQSAPVALTIAGSDCSSGAGLQADLKTFGAFGVFGLTAVTCVVAEVPGKVSRIDAVDPANLSRQIEVCLAHFPVTAIKTGLLLSAENVALVADLLARLAPTIPVVVDPVMVATSGDILLQPEAMELYRERLLPRASLITPNLSEAAVLANRTVCNLDEMRAVGSRARAKIWNANPDQRWPSKGQSRDRFALRRWTSEGVFRTTDFRRGDSRYRLHLFSGNHRRPRSRRRATRCDFAGEGIR